MRIQAFVFALALLVPTKLVQAAQRVACIGDSITFGSGVEDRAHNAYPVQLGNLLGPEWEVRNFGLSSRTLLRKGDLSYVETEEFQSVLAWRPDITVVILGTNDTCQDERRSNWEHAADLEADARALALELLAMSDDARVILSTPTPMFADAAGVPEERRANLRERAPRLQRVAAAVRQVARELERVDFLDLSDVFDASQVVDGAHTTPFGAEAIARRVAECLLNPKAPALSLVQALAERGCTSSQGEFQGFRRHDFSLGSDGGESASCVLVEPETPAVGYPWIWRARFFGHEPELERELLARGYHLAYCEVAGLFGADAALQRWDRFHELCTELGLSKRVTLEGMSRGGLVVLNWAARNADKVEAIYLDNPVCDFRSWPGGMHGKRSDADWEACLAAYGLNESEAATYSNMPLDRLQPLAEARVPMFVVLGSADEVVPPSENGEELARRYRELGASVEVWRKPGAGHHPHGLHPVAPLLRALLRVTGRAQNPAQVATPSAEYRGTPAGWGGGTWWDQLEKLRALADEANEIQVVFLGDSITQGLTGSSDRVARVGGERIFDEYHGERSAVSLGLSGDRTEHLLYRIEHGALARMDPKVIVVMIGVNNVNSAGHTGVETAEGVVAVMHSLLQREAQAQILLCGPFPCGATPDNPRRVALDEVHARIAPLDELARVTYMDLRALFLDENGSPNDLMRGDHVHITPKGQKAWMAAIEPVLAQLLAR